MMRVFLTRAVLGALVLVSHGARVSSAQQANAQAETLIRLSVSPAPASRPALRYTLLPELTEISPGNPIEGYLKCQLERYRFKFDEAGFEERKTLLSMPLVEPATPDFRTLGRSALIAADRAARLDNPDWQVLLKLKADGVNTLLPDLSAIRGLAKELQGRARAEVADGRLDDALRTLKTMFAMARHVGVHPTLIGGLVGVAIARMALDPLELMLEQPGCPNLYWALTELPDPFVAIKTGMDGERMIMTLLFRDLSSNDSMTAEQIKKIIEPLEMIFNAGKPAGTREYLAARTADEQKMAAARKRLVDSGLSESSVKAYAADRVILLDEVRECQDRLDEIATIAAFPPWQFESLAEARRATKKDPALFADALSKVLASAPRAHGRFKQRIALLRHVEALRLYAADHGGALPAELADMSVPLPEDPFTGKPVRYEVTGKSAHLRGSPPAGEQNDVTYRLHYEISLKN